MNTSQMTYDTRQRLASEYPDMPLPCCYQPPGEGCPNDATHWILSVRLGAWQVVEALPADARLSPPPFCERHADLVCAQRNTAKPSPVPWVAPKGKQKEKRP